ncbi:hypothetical protein OEZ85_002853 [Tetradesmus obliquus]|uniref:TauD/TfdA-like domain-containing protein n=1 Tax=Tetradesmus obliquus TaxID=3088 RepID=A0ABY8TYT6_TETOB|nr:hypothetical protein OEZ85_002853 [Tetradesmus obliquus]
MQAQLKTSQISPLRRQPAAWRQCQHTWRVRSAAGSAAPPTVLDQSSGPLQGISAPPFDAAAVRGLLPCRQGSVVPYAPICGPDVWYGQQQRQQQEQWVHTLTAAQVRELEAAVAAVQQRLQLQAHGNYITGLMRLRDPAQFPLPLLSPVLAAMRQELTAGRGFYMIKGLPVQHWSREQVMVAYWGIGVHLGVAIPQNQKGHLIGHVKDVGVDPLCQNPATRIYMTRAAQPWHVDSCDIVGLLCLQPAKSGGQSSWASSSAIYNELLAVSPEAVAALAGSWYLDRKGELPPGKLPYFVMPVLHLHQGYLTVSFHDSYYQAAAARFPGQVPRLTPTQQAALALFNEIANRDVVRLDYWLEPGDMQFVNNHNVVHMRSQFEDWEEPSKKRHLLRLQLVVPGLRPLPAAAFEALWGPLAADDRCAQQLAALADAADPEQQQPAAAHKDASRQRAGQAAAAAGDVAVPSAGGGAVSALAARFGGSGMGCIPLDAEVGNKLRD